MANKYSAESYRPIINAASEQYGVPVEVIEEVMRQESGYNPAAKSGAGAQGLMQLMPATAKELGVTNINDPEQNIMAGTRYLAQQYEKFGNLEQTLAAYNSGPGNVRKAIKNGRDIPNIAETQNYVKSISSKVRSRWSTPQMGQNTLLAGPGVGEEQDTLPDDSNIATDIYSNRNEDEDLIAGIQNAQPSAAPQKVEYDAGAFVSEFGGASNLLPTPTINTPTAQPNPSAASTEYNKDSFVSEFSKPIGADPMAVGAIPLDTNSLQNQLPPMPEDNSGGFLQSLSAFGKGVTDLPLGSISRVPRYLASQAVGRVMGIEPELLSTVMQQTLNTGMEDAQNTALSAVTGQPVETVANLEETNPYAFTGGKIAQALALPTGKLKAGATVLEYAGRGILDSVLFSALDRNTTPKDMARAAVGGAIVGPIAGKTIDAVAGTLKLPLHRMLGKNKNIPDLAEQVAEFPKLFRPRDMISADKLKNRALKVGQEAMVELDTALASSPLTLNIKDILTKAKDRHGSPIHDLYRGVTDAEKKAYDKVYGDILTGEWVTNAAPIRQANWQKSKFWNNAYTKKGEVPDQYKNLVNDAAGKVLKKEIEIMLKNTPVAALNRLYGITQEVGKALHSSGKLGLTDLAEFYTAAQIGRAVGGDPLAIAAMAGKIGTSTLPGAYGLSKIGDFIGKAGQSPIAQKVYNTLFPAAGNETIDLLNQ